MGMLKTTMQVILGRCEASWGEPERDMTVSTRLRDSVFTETHGLENALKVNMNENTCICPFVKCRVSAGTRKRRSKKGDLSCRIDCYSYVARFGTKHAGQAISRAYGKSNYLFLVKFYYILPACLTKKSVIYVQNSSPERSDYTQ